MIIAKHFDVELKTVTGDTITGTSDVYIDSLDDNIRLDGRDGQIVIVNRDHIVWVNCQPVPVEESYGDN